MTKTMPQIKHVVHLMLENRSLDNLLGWLYAANQNKPPLNLIDVQNPAVYHGLTGNEYNVGKDGERHYINVPPPGNLTIPPFDPHEVFKHVHIQCYTSQDGKSVGNKPEMGGFYQDYESMLDSPEDIMLAFTPDELPVLNGLARNFAVCDKWYASVPSQTFCNRAFAATGNSVGKNILTGEVQGWVDNSIFLDYTSTTHWEVLSRNGKNSPDDWMIYYSQKFWWSPAYCLTRDLFRTTLGDVKYDQHFAHIDDFFTKAATGKLPSYSFLEPNWGLMYWQFGIDGTDYHPPGNVCPGEVFVKKIYDALSQGPSWNETLLIITFDEHGGTYDHIPVALNAAPPTSDKGQYGFKFDTFGVRVPAMLISPWVPQGAVFRMPEGQTPFDHTAVIATLLNWFGIDRSLWNMGARVAAAPTFENVLCLDKPRTDIPVVTPPVCPEDAQVDRPVTDLHHLIAARSWRYGQERKV